MDGQPRPVETTVRGRGPIIRFRLWHGMVAILVTALGLWAIATSDSPIWILPFTLGIALLGGILSGFLVFLPFFLVVVILIRVGQGRQPKRNR